MKTTFLVIIISATVVSALSSVHEAIDAVKISTNRHHADFLVMADAASVPSSSNNYSAAPAPYENFGDYDDDNPF